MQASVLQSVLPIVTMTIATSENIQSAARRIADILRQPGAVALVPTETVYGLICRASDAAAVEKIRNLKHRDPSKFFGWFIRDYMTPEKYGLVYSDAAKKLAECYFPGALTLIVNTAQGGTQAVRVPEHPLIFELLKYFDEPLVQTSANASGMPDALSCSQALSQLDGEPDVYFEGEDLPAGAAGSTIVNTTVIPPQIIRQGKLAVKF